MSPLVRASATATATAAPDRVGLARRYRIATADDLSTGPQALLGITITTFNNTASDAASTVNDASFKVMSSVNNSLLSYPGSKIETISYSLSPLYNTSETPPTLTGWSATQLLQATIDSSTSDLGKALSGAIDAAISSSPFAGISSIAFALKDPSFLDRQALANAAKLAVDNAKTLAGAVGLGIKRILTVNQTGGGGVQPVFLAEAAPTASAPGGGGGAVIVPSAIKSVQSVTVEMEAA